MNTTDKIAKTDKAADKEKEKVKGQDLFKKDTKKSDKPKSDKPKSDKEVSKEKVQIAKDLDNAEQISKDPMGTAEKLGDLLSDVRDELEELQVEILKNVSEAEQKKKLKGKAKPEKKPKQDKGKKLTPQGKEWVRAASEDMAEITKSK